MAETNTTTVIGKDTFIKGEMRFESAAKILGKFEGTLTAKAELHIGDGANCKATVDGTTIIVDGEIEGNVTARERACLNATARIIGDITAKTLVVAEGATFTGRCQVGAEAIEKATAAAAEERPVTVETRVSRNRFNGYEPKIAVNGEAASV